MDIENDQLEKPGQLNHSKVAQNVLTTNEQEEEELEIIETSKLDTKYFFITIAVLLIVPMILFTFRALSGVSRKSIANYYIPQPFTELNMFNSFVFRNDLNALFMKPNRKDAKIYLCKIKSFISWCRYCSRSSRFRGYSASC